MKICFHPSSADRWTNCQRIHRITYILTFLEKQCDILRDPIHGEVHQTGRYLGDRAIYTCTPGWEIVGAEERVCQATGLWTNQEPFCKKRGK